MPSEVLIFMGHRKLYLWVKDSTGPHHVVRKIVSPASSLRFSCEFMGLLVFLSCVKRKKDGTGSLKCPYLEGSSGRGYKRYHL